MNALDKAEREAHKRRQGPDGNLFKEVGKLVRRLWKKRVKKKD